MSDIATLTAPFKQFGAVESIKRTQLEKLVAKAMERNATTIPHVTHHDEIDVTDSETLRKSLPSEKRPSPLIYLIKAAADALKTYPQFKASLSDNGEILLLKQYFNIGIAVDSRLDLLVPVLRGGNTKSLEILSAEPKEVSTRARSKGLPLVRPVWSSSEFCASRTDATFPELRSPGDQRRCCSSIREAGRHFAARSTCRHILESIFIILNFRVVRSTFRKPSPAAV